MPWLELFQKKIQYLHNLISINPNPTIKSV